MTEVDGPGADPAERAWALRFEDPRTARAILGRLDPGPRREVVDGFLAWREQRLDVALHTLVHALDDPALPRRWATRAHGTVAAILYDLGLLEEAVDAHMERLSDPGVTSDPLAVAAVQHDLGLTREKVDPVRSMRHYAEAYEIAHDVRTGAVRGPVDRVQEAHGLEALACVHAHLLAARLGIPLPDGVVALTDAENLARRAWPDLADGIRAERAQQLLDAGCVERAARLARSLPDPDTISDARGAAAIARVQSAVLAAQGAHAEAVALLRRTSERIPPTLASELLGLLVTVHESAGESDAALAAAKARLAIVLDLSAEGAGSTARALGAWYRSRRAAARDREADRIIHELRRTVDDVADDRDRLAERLGTDDLTGLHNRRHLLATAQQLPAGTHAVAVLDVDDFKRVNDDHGHLAGDEALRRVASRLAAAARTGDVVCRLGGDEFVVVRPEGDPGGLARDLEGVVEVPDVVAGRPARLSVGVATFRDGDVLGGVEVADHVMYEGKRAGGGIRVDPGPSAPSASGPASGRESGPASGPAVASAADGGATA